MSCRWWTLFLLVPAVAAAAHSQATPGTRWWGVIVGVGAYEHLDASLALEGPPNDIPPILSWLHRQGVPRQHLTVLADQVAGADGLPTRAAILGALRALPEHMSPGDIAFLYFAGHGSQQPQGGAELSKADGLDEIFLPRDVAGWDPESGVVKGAIAGRDIGPAVEALRSRGIFVWLVVDSCHSATIARALMIPKVRSRGVAPADLGVPDTEHSRSRGPAAPPGSIVKLRQADHAGDYVAFYAAQTVDTAPEMPLPPGEAHSQVHGLFTYSLLKALGATGAGSYREVAHRILAIYASMYPSTTPEFEGALDGAIGAPGAPLLAPGNWPAVRIGSGFRIESGELNGITPHSLLALYAATPRSKNEPPLGLLRVNKVSLSDSWADVVTDAAQLKEWKMRADRSDTVASGVVQVLRTDIDTKVRLAGPAMCFPSMPAPYGCALGGIPTDTEALARARDLLAKPGCLPPGAELVSSLDPADLFLWVKDSRLFVVRAGAPAIEPEAGVDIDSPRAVKELGELLFKANRSVALTRLAADFPEALGELTAQARAREPSGHWHTIGDEGAVSVPFGTELSLRLQNTGPSDLDVTIFALDDRFAITPVYPVDQESNLLRKGGAPIEISGWARTAGDNRVLVIAEKARAGRPHDLSYLAQPGVARHADERGLATVLEHIGFSPPGTRSSLEEGDRGEVSIKLMRYEVARGP